MVKLILTLFFIQSIAAVQNDMGKCHTDFGTVPIGKVLNLPGCVQMTCEMQNQNATLVKRDCSTVEDKPPAHCTYKRKRRNSYPFCCYACSSPNSNFLLHYYSGDNKVLNKFEDITRTRRNSNTTQLKATKPSFYLPLRNKPHSRRLKKPNAQALKVHKGAFKTLNSIEAEIISPATAQVQHKKLSSLLAGKIRPVNITKIVKKHASMQKNKTKGKLMPEVNATPKPAKNRRYRFYFKRNNRFVPDKNRRRKIRVLTGSNSTETPLITVTPKSNINSSPTKLNAVKESPSKNRPIPRRRRVFYLKTSRRKPKDSKSKDLKPKTSPTSKTNDTSTKIRPIITTTVKPSRKKNQKETEYPKITNPTKPKGFHRRRNFITKRVYSNKDIPVQEISVGQNTEYSFSSVQNPTPLKQATKKTDNTKENEIIETKPDKRTNDSKTNETQSAPENIFSSQMIDFGNFDKYFSAIVADNKLPFDLDISSTNQDHSMDFRNPFSIDDSIFDDVPVTTSSVSIVESRKSFSASENRETKKKISDSPLYAALTSFREKKFP